jgi:hypothetical protein
MKVYITADIEGVTGATHWDETDKKNPDYGEFQEQMTAEVVAACEGALNAGATEIWVRDAHWTGRNIIPSKLPREAKLVRGWSGHPFSMMQGLDETLCHDQWAVCIGISDLCLYGGAGGRARGVHLRRRWHLPGGRDIDPWSGYRRCPAGLGKRDGQHPPAFGG